MNAIETALTALAAYLAIAADFVAACDNLCRYDDDATDNYNVTADAEDAAYDVYTAAYYAAEDAYDRAANRDARNFAEIEDGFNKLINPLDIRKIALR